jgi:hypothetical protein
MLLRQDGRAQMQRFAIFSGQAPSIFDTLGGKGNLPRGVFFREVMPCLLRSLMCRWANVR